MAAPPPPQSFDDILKEHQARRAALVAENEQRKAAVLEGLGGYTDSLMESVNAQVAVAFDRQRALEAEIKALQKETGDFVKRSAKWVALVASFNESLKEIGDIENWSRTIESDMADVASLLENVHARSGAQ